MPRSRFCLGEVWVGRVRLWGRWPPWGKSSERGGHESTMSFGRLMTFALSGARGPTEQTLSDSRCLRNILTESHTTGRRLGRNICAPRFVFAHGDEQPTQPPTTSALYDLDAHRCSRVLAFSSRVCRTFRVQQHEAKAVGHLETCRCSMPTPCNWSAQSWLHNTP